MQLLIAFPSLPQQSPVHNERKIQAAEKSLPEHRALTSPLIACDTCEVRRGGGWSNSDCCWPVNRNFMFGCPWYCGIFFFFLVELTFEGDFSSAAHAEPLPARRQLAGISAGASHGSHPWEQLGAPHSPCQPGKTPLAGLHCAAQLLCTT